jgi:hypothetical protein
MKEIAEINLAYQHKPFNPLTEMHQHFLASYHAKTKALQANTTPAQFSMYPIPPHFHFLHHPRFISQPFGPAVSLLLFCRDMFRPVQ